MSSEHFEKTEALLLIFLLLLDQFFNKLLELGFASFRDERLLEKNLVDESINVSPIICEKNGRESSQMLVKISKYLMFRESQREKEKIPDV